MLSLNKIVPLFAVIFGVSLLQAADLNSPAPRFTLMDSHHRKHALVDYRGRVVLINFWASWCSPCQEELPELNRLAGDYRGKKVNILAINVDEDRTAAKTLLRKLGLTSPPMQILWDSKSKVVSAYNINTMPTSFILDPQGIIRFVHSGFHHQDPTAWRQEIDRLKP